MAFHPEALKKAESKLRILRETLPRIESCNDFDKFTDLWYIFLVAGKNVYTALKQGATATPQDRQWFGGKESERRRDSLLQYVFEARNQDEHEITPTAQLEPSRVTFSTGVGGKGISVSGVYPQKFNVKSVDEAPMTISSQPEHVKLLPVTNEFKQTFQPPTLHLNNLLQDQSPYNLAKLTLAYLEGLVSEAASRA